AEDVKLVVVGSGSERRRLERRYGSRRIIFTGQVIEEAERIAMVRAMDVFVLPSLVEGLPLSLLEAMACGEAPVATDVGSDGEAVRGPGMVVDPRDLDGQLRQDEERMRRILLDLPPQISDVDIDHAGLDWVLVAPHMVDDLFAGQPFAGVRGEERQQVELRVGQQHLTGIVEDAALVEIDD